MTTTTLEDRTSEFMHALAAADVDAANISASRTDGGMAVDVDLPAVDDAVQNAESVADNHAFVLRGRIGPGRFEGRNRYRFDAVDADGEVR